MRLGLLMRGDFFYIYIINFIYKRTNKATAFGSSRPLIRFTYFKFYILFGLHRWFKFIIEFQFTFESQLTFEFQH